MTIEWARPSSSGCGIALLDARERARADTFVRAEDRRRFIAQHALLRSTVGELTASDPRRLELGSQCPVCGGTDHGRPVLQTDASVRLSASRSGQRVVVAVARGDAPIGIDVEPTITTGSDGIAFDAVAFDAVAFDTVAFDTVAFDTVALTPGERAQVMARPEPERAFARTATWVRKEAVLKRAGIGLTTPPAEFDVVRSGDVLTEVDVGAGYQCALATGAPARVTVVDATARLAGLATRL